ncbi:MAG: outer membrane beta-barrel protein [Flavobacteriales bacterium]|nr:outer membrane beta-barrel protein [Flavobacteriales bacterium]
MKKTLTFTMVLLSLVVFGQSQVKKGNFLIEANLGTSQTGNTNFFLTTSNEHTAWGIGLDGGYFIIDRLALKAGFGYSSDEDHGVAKDRFAYKIGAKYYIIDKIPVGLDFTGESKDDGGNTSDTASWIGIQGGYAWFVSKHISVEPTLRYNFTTDDQKADSFLGLHVGFSLFF